MCVADSSFAKAPMEVEKVVWKEASMNTTATLTFWAFAGGGLALGYGITWYPLQIAALFMLGLAALLSGLLPVEGADKWKAQLLENPTLSLDALFFFSTYLLPICLVRMAIEREGPPSLLGFLIAFTETFSIVGVCMSVCLHRYFSHQAFKTSRAFQVVLCFMGCMAFQGDPLWWASKHRRHHKYCDAPEDPHSWTQTNYLYAWIGWTCNPKERATDYEFLGGLRRYPELRVIGALWWLWPVLLNLAVEKYFGFYAMVLYCTVPMLMSRIVTLIFNVEYHPPDGGESALGGHGEGAVAPAPAAEEAEKEKDVFWRPPCRSLDMARFLADCVGESCHDDHHANPQRAQRPSGGFPHYDLPYIFVIKPWVWLGLVWNPNILANNPVVNVAAGKEHEKNKEEAALGWDDSSPLAPDAPSPLAAAPEADAPTTRRRRNYSQY